MDQRLVAWARAVKSRRRSGVPVLWLFTDPLRLADPCAAAALLPRGLAGVVYRPSGSAQAALGRRLARICRQRRLGLVVAGDWRLAAALHAGVHLRGGRRPPAPCRAVTSSAHDAAELVRAQRAGAKLAFLSPAFVTPSHPGAPALGPLRWGMLARRAGIRVAALGGIDGASVRRLPPSCRGAGAIGALSPSGSGREK